MNYNLKSTYLKFTIKLLFCCFYLLQSHISIAQITISSVPPKVTLPSPTAFSMIKYTDAPINISGGRPDVTIPIYSINEPGITVPIAYNYGAGGIKVDEVASSYGLGWNLVAGGAITRVVRGIMDESGIKKNKSDFDDMTLLLGGGANPVDIGGLRYSKGITDTSFGCEYFDVNKYNNYTQGTRAFNKDLEPDVFYFNFGGYSGKFMFENGISPGDESVVPVFFPKRNDIKISRVMGTDKLYPNIGVDRTIIKEWELTTPDGVQYYFGQNDMRECNYNYVYTTDDLLYKKEEITGWFLTRIYNPLTKEEVVFNYNAHNYSYESAIDEVYSRAEDVYDFCRKDAGLKTQQLKVNHSAVKTYVLSEINSSKIKVSFKGGVNREDVELYNIFVFKDATYDKLKVIDKIEIFDKWHKKILKSYNLNYSYFISDLQQSSFLPNYTAGSDYKRLRLDSITELNASSEALPSYVFSYYDQTSIASLPRRLSLARDKWGYYNGFLSNLRLLPFCENAAIRDSDPIKAKAFMLKNVAYPTGGTHSFEYGYNAGIRLDKITIQDVNSGVPIVNQYSYDQGTLLNVTNEYEFSNPATIADVTVVGDIGNSLCNTVFVANGDHFNNTFYLQANPDYISPGMGSFRPLKILSSSPILSSQIPNFSSPIYGMITVANIENNITKGKHVYGYHRPSYLSWLDKYPSIPEENSLYGKPQYEEYWDANGTLLRREDYDYTETYDTRRIKGIAMSSSKCYLNNSDTQNWTSDMIFYRFYDLISKSCLLRKKTITEYLNGQPLINTEEYLCSFNNINDLPNRITKSNSDGSTTVENKLYSSQFYASGSELTYYLYNRNRLQELIQTDTSKDGVPVSKSTKDYEVQSSGLYLPSEIFTAKGTNPLESKLRFYDYDEKGNPLEFYSPGDGTRTVIVWGYNKQYPIAEIKAKVITYAFFTSYATNLQNLSNLDIDTTSEENLRTALNNLRVTFPDDMITTYTYDPNIGMTSVTDPKGDKTTYTYDSFGRLQFVKNADGNILNNNEYHYKN
jgi:YD repeat-containing protein